VSPRTASTRARREATPATPLRSDAARNRAAILAAARELFASGRDVPMYEIGRRAGVGQATLYRHFPDRPAVVAAITREHIERIEAIAAAAGDADQPVVLVLAAGAEMLVCIHDLLGILRDDATLAPILDELRRRMLAVLETTLERSSAGGLVGGVVDAHAQMLVLDMVNGALVGVSATDERAAAAKRALELALGGLCTGAGRPPSPAPR
jgi:AcrR family transcriptional regulator